MPRTQPHAKQPTGHEWYEAGSEPHHSPSLWSVGCVGPGDRAALPPVREGAVSPPRTRSHSTAASLVAIPPTTPAMTLTAASMRPAAGSLDLSWSWRLSRCSTRGGCRSVGHSESPRHQPHSQQVDSLQAQISALHFSPLLPVDSLDTVVCAIELTVPCIHMPHVLQLQTSVPQFHRIKYRGEREERQANFEQEVLEIFGNGLCWQVGESALLVGSGGGGAAAPAPVFGTDAAAGRAFRALPDPFTCFLLA